MWFFKRIAIKYSVPALKGIHNYSTYNLNVCFKEIHRNNFTSCKFEMDRFLRLFFYFQLRIQSYSCSCVKTG